eukprot:1046108-Prorocentrum_minimum.AAC.1
MGGYARGGNQSSEGEGWEDVPGETAAAAAAAAETVETNRRRDGRIYPGRAPIAEGEREYAIARTTSEGFAGRRGRAGRRR